MNEFQKEAEGIFARFAEKLSKVDLKLAVSVPAVIGATVAVAGCALEAHGELTLLKHGGIAAVNAYKDTLVQYPFGEFLLRGLEGKLPSFGGNAQARGLAFMAAAPIVSAAAVTLARGFQKIKAALHGQGEQMRRETTQAVLAAEPAPVDEEGRYTWARNRSTESNQGQDWRHAAHSEMREPPGTVEMLRRIALAHRVNVLDLELRGDKVVLNTGRWSSSREHAAPPPWSASVSPGFRPICEVGSPFWRETERQVYILNRYARHHGLNAAALYVRDDVVYEENPEAFVDRKVCDVNSLAWDAAHRELIGEELGYSSASLEDRKRWGREEHEAYGTSPNHRTKIRMA
ncbi:hypothetical protein [Burkholderia ubonensis]|uniref:hypothetical protein n=1 Tax=Burkholderia ubonensis TaxID=101571 RepID=UPI000752B0FD|nr:hypothetical protein [Burkholderia ubonensis]KVO15213.1 hypothetical protein WJ74_11215 [Burkholderia ubonensis]KVT01196.1 hypothetical protein WK47_25315 [Burkholderia ubonensis]KVT07373.1 hypothetical protein WK46_10595 [Burkholderia ubonensis]KVT33851.1 hypothetical protein WK50_02690 [Burkholderia ubonensis]